MRLSGRTTLFHGSNSLSEAIAKQGAVCLRRGLSFFYFSNIIKAMYIGNISYTAHERIMFVYTEDKPTFLPHLLNFFYTGTLYQFKIINHTHTIFCPISFI
jgi:hypothetical protein